jgi:hypothetical protein
MTVAGGGKSSSFTMNWIPLRLGALDGNNVISTMVSSSSETGGAGKNSSIFLDRLLLSPYWLQLNIAVTPNLYSYIDNSVAIKSAVIAFDVKSKRL